MSEPNHSLDDLTSAAAKLLNCSDELAREIRELSHRHTNLRTAIFLFTEEIEFYARALKIRKDLKP